MSNTPQDQDQLEELILKGQIKRAGELVAEGEYDRAACVLPSVNVFDVMRLRLLIENHVRSEEELSHLRETPLEESETYRHLLSLCDETQKETYLKLDEACRENQSIRGLLERGYNLLAYEYYEQATAYAANLAELYPERAEIWNLVILAKSKLSPARDFDTAIEKRAASLEKFPEYKEMISCMDYPYLQRRPEYAERYLKTKSDIAQEKKAQIVREKTKLSVVFARVTLCLGIASLCILLPFFFLFDSVAGIVIGVFGAMIAIGSLICNIRVSLLDPKRPMREATLAYLLIIVLIAVYLITMAIAIPMIPVA